MAETQTQHDGTDAMEMSDLENLVETIDAHEDAGAKIEGGFFENVRSLTIYVHSVDPKRDDPSIISGPNRYPARDDVDSVLQEHGLPTLDSDDWNNDYAPVRLSEPTEYKSQASQSVLSVEVDQ